MYLFHCVLIQKLTVGTVSYVLLYNKCAFSSTTNYIYRSLRSHYAIRRRMFGRNDANGDRLRKKRSRIQTSLYVRFGRIEITGDAFGYRSKDFFYVQSVFCKLHCLIQKMQNLEIVYSTVWYDTMFYTVIRFQVTVGHTVYVGYVFEFANLELYCRIDCTMCTVLCTISYLQYIVQYSTVCTVLYSVHAYFYFSYSASHSIGLYIL